MASNKLEMWAKKAKKNWSDATEVAKAGGGFKQFDNGVYIGHLTRAEVVEAKNSGKLQVHFSTTIQEGDETGEIYHRYLPLEEEWSLEALAREFQAYGYDPEDIDPSDLEDQLEQLVMDNIYYKFRLSKNTKNPDGAQYFSIIKVLDDYAPEETSAVFSEEKQTKTKADKTVASNKSKSAKTPEPEEEDEEEDDELEEETDDDENDEDDDEDEDDEDNEDEEETDEEAVELEPGVKVNFPDPQNAKKRLHGKVVEVNEETKKVKVKSGVKLYNVPFSALDLDEDDDE